MAGFGEALKGARKAKGYTLKKLAGNIGTSISYLSDIEHDRKPPPSLELVSKMEEFLGVNDDTLVSLANQIRKSIKATSNLSRKLKADQRSVTIMYMVERLTDEEKDKLIENLSARTIS